MRLSSFGEKAKLENVFVHVDIAEKTYLNI